MTNGREEQGDPNSRDERALGTMRGDQDRRSVLRGTVLPIVTARDALALTARQSRATRSPNLVVIAGMTSGREQRGDPNSRDERAVSRKAIVNQDSRVNVVLWVIDVRSSLLIGRASERAQAEENPGDALNGLLLRSRSDSLHAASVRVEGADFQDREIRNAETPVRSVVPVVTSARPTVEIAAAVPDTLSSSLARF